MQGAIRYLMATYDPALGVWPIIPSTVRRGSARARWAYDDQLAERWHGFKANPRLAEIVGYLFEYPNLSPASLRKDLGEAVAVYLETFAENVETHDLLCYVRLVQTSASSEPLRSWLLSAGPRGGSCCSQEPSAWAQYGLKPLWWVAESPELLFAGQLAGAYPA